MLLGFHPSGAGGLHMAVRRAARASASTLQLFTAIPKFYNEKASVKPERLARYQQALSDAGIKPHDVLVHAGYVLNTASPESEKWERAAAALARELERSTAIQARGVCFHPGSAGKSGRDDAIGRVAEAMTRALRAVTDGSSTRLLVENTAGAGNTIGRTAQEIADILKLIPADIRSRAGYGLDSCHLFASGYPIHESAERLAAILDEFQVTIGEPPAFFHLNDSQGELGSNRDRHALIGEGRIGLEPFRWLVNDRRAADVPLILETPQENEDVAEDDDTPDPSDVRMLNLVRSLVQQ